MFNERIATIYTSPDDTWESTSGLSGLAQDELVELNPHLADVEAIEPGIPIDIPGGVKRQLFTATARSARSISPYQVAQKELLLNIAEDPRPSKDHPRIRLYHSTTSGGASPDEVAWCSSFMNYCTEQAGLAGTDSKASRSWLRWGEAVSKDDWQEGDVIVSKRENSSWMGHVGFLVDWRGSRPTVLGGNQSDRLSIATPYPFRDILGIRRAP
jgi:uncharacterized protein (TIGR02594 family)